MEVEIATLFYESLELGRHSETDGDRFSLAARLSRYDVEVQHIHETTPSEPVYLSKKHLCSRYDPTSMHRLYDTLKANANAN